MKRAGIIALALVVALLAAGCSEPLIRTGAGTDAWNGYEPAAPRSGGSQTDTSGNGSVTSFTVRATKYDFNLREIRVNQGDTVEIRLENMKGYHTLKLEGYNLEAKKNRPITFVATEKGQFAFRCGVVCGNGHDGMTGVLIVE